MENFDYTVETTKSVDETVAAIENGRQDATLITALRMSHALRTQVPNIFREQPFPKLIGSERGESRTA